MKYALGKFEGLIPHSLHPSLSLATTHFKKGLAHSLKRMMPEENGEIHHMDMVDARCVWSDEFMI